MPVEMAIWRMTTDGPVAVEFSGLGSEERLEDMVVSDPSLLGEDLLTVGRQVLTNHGGFIDVLGVDGDGHLHVLELKRNKTPRDVVAQALDYATWVQDLTLDDVNTIYSAQHDNEFATAFAEHFGAPIPEVFNADQQLTIVAGVLDPASDRIITFLAEKYGVPINAVFFRYFADGDVDYLARTWLIEPAEAEAHKPRSGSASKVRPWNGTDYYCVLGTVDDGSERWEMGRKYGFVGAGGGSWYSKPLRNLTPGKRVFAYVGGAGYVGVGEVTGTVTPLRDFISTGGGGGSLKVVDQPDVPDWMSTRALDMDEENTEYAVPVKWLAERSISEAVMERGLFASQHSACKLKDERTIEVVSAAFGLS